MVKYQIVTGLLALLPKARLIAAQRGRKPAGGGGGGGVPICREQGEVVIPNSSDTLWQSVSVKRNAATEAERLLGPCTTDAVCSTVCGHQPCFDDVSLKRNRSSMALSSYLTQLITIDLSIASLCDCLVRAVALRWC